MGERKSRVVCTFLGHLSTEHERQQRVESFEESKDTSARVGIRG